MPLIGSFTTPGSNSTFLSPRITPGSTGLGPANLAPEQQQALTQRLFNTKYQENRGLNVFEKVGGYVAGSVVDTADTLWGNQLNPIGDRGDVWNLVGDYGGEVGADLRNFYESNASAIETISGIGGAIAVGYLGGSMLLPRLSNAMASSTAINQSRLWQWGARANAATRARMLEAQAEVAAAGESFRIWKHAAGRSYLANRAGRMAGVAAFEEGLIVATLNGNKTVWSEDMSENLFWGGVGLVTGGIIGTVTARSEMRKLANSPSLIKLREEAADPQAFARLRLHQPESDFLAGLKGAEIKESAKTTALLVASRETTPEGAAPEMATRFNTFRAETRAQALQSMQKIASKGVEGAGQTNFRVDTKGGVGAHLDLLTKADPTSLHGLESLGSLENSTINDVMTARETHISRLRESEEAQQINRARRLEEEQALVLVDGQWLPAETPEAKALSHYHPGKTDFKSAKGTAEFRFKSESGGEFKVDESFRFTRSGARYTASETPNATRYYTTDDGKIFSSNLKQVEAAAKEGNQAVHYVDVPKGQSAKELTPELAKKKRLLKVKPTHNRFSDLSINDRMTVIEGLHRVMQAMKDQGLQYVVPYDASWFQIDAAIQFEKTGGEVDWRKIGVNTAEEAELRSLQLKAEEIGDSHIGSVWDRVSYNLPLPSSAERIYDAAGDSLRAVLEAARQGAAIEELKILRAQVQKMHGFELLKADDVKLSGNLFNFNRDESGKWRPMALGYFANESYVKPMNDAGLAEAMAELKAARYHALIGGDDRLGNLTKLVPLLHSLPEFRQSMNIAGLADDQITGVGSFATQFLGEALTREMRLRDSKVGLATLRVRETVNRESDAYLRALIQQHLGDLTARLSAAPNVASKTLVNQFLSNASGWDLRKNPVPLEGGKWGFTLMKTENNKARLGREVNDDEFLMNPRTGTQIVLDDLGVSWLDGFQSISRHILEDKNRIRLALGLPLLKSRNWYVPPPNTKGKLVAFTFDENDQPVAGGAIIASTQAEFDRIRADKMKSLPATHSIRTREQLEATADAWDRAAMDWIDPGVGSAPAGQQRGFLSGELVNPNAVGDTLQWVKGQVERIGTDTMRTLYDSQLGLARVRGATERAMKGLKPLDQAGKETRQQIRSVWDEYQAIVLGQNLGDSQFSISGSVMHKIEGFIDGGIETFWPALSYLAPSQIGNWLGDLGQRTGMRTPKAFKTYDKLAEALGPYTPFKNAMDYAEQTLKVSRPPKMQNFSEKMNKLSAAVLLRWFEIPHAAMNLLGIVTTMPSIVSSGRAPITMSFDSHGRKVGVVDNIRILRDAIGDMTSGRRKSDWEFMVKNGDTTQAVAEFNQEMALVTDRGSWSRIFEGTGSKQGMKGAKGLFKEKGIDGLISIATDTTEGWSRTYSHFVGLRLADFHGIQGMEARHSFAREIANAAIANYNPLNRPELYQSAFGSMFGLFMSWMQSYNQRLFRWMEEGEYAKFGQQLGMQSALFGVTSLPAYKLVEKSLLMAGVGQTDNGQEATLTDHIYAKFGPALGAAIAHGGIQETGIVLYTRGDMNYRDLTLDPTRLMAGFGVGAKVISAVRESAQSLFNDYALEDSGRISEILSRHMPNRVLKGIMIELLNDGQDIDSAGRIVSENRSFFESAVRMTGLRTQRQQAEIEAFYANRHLKQREAARLEVLRQETRAMIRNDPNWKSNLQSVFDKYVRNGSRPEHFRTWIRDQIREATSTRGINDLAGALRNPKNQMEVWRYNAYGAN